VVVTLGLVTFQTTRHGVIVTSNILGLHPCAMKPRMEDSGVHGAAVWRNYLIRDPASFNANVTVVNTGTAAGQTVQVEIFDWGVEQLWSKPTPVPVSPSAAVAIGAHTQQDFIALITQSTAQPSLNLVLYEIRITVPAKSPLIINCFAINLQGGLVAANTVLHAQLVTI